VTFQSDRIIRAALLWAQRYFGNTPQQYEPVPALFIDKRQ
jgi:hypothetical protein